MGVGAGGSEHRCYNSDTREILRQGPRMVCPLRILLVTQEPKLQSWKEFGSKWKKVRNPVTGGPWVHTQVLRMPGRQRQACPLSVAPFSLGGRKHVCYGAASPLKFTEIFTRDGGRQ